MSSSADRGAAFEQRMVDILNAGALNLAMGLGYQLGLFEAMAGGEASPVQDIAITAGVDVRYLEEWLGAMVCGGIVELVVTGDTSTLR